MTRKNGRNTDGTFALGNPGKPKGSRHKTTQAVLMLLEGEADALTRTAVDAALKGDMVALRLCLERIVPPRKDTPVTFAIPHVTTVAEAVQAAGAVVGAVCAGELTPTEGAHVMGLLEKFRRALEASELEARIAALEKGSHGHFTEKT